jgi:catechol 2,3-dioxygenase
MPIDPKARIGAVHLTVSDLDRAASFYTQHVGFTEHWRRDDTAGLGVREGDLLVLHESRSAVRTERSTGLYHFAILVPSRLDLARSLRHFAELRTPMQGVSDHAVSEALYLADPDGNGIEVYRDRPRAEWPRESGRLKMTLDPLDVQGLLREADADARRHPDGTWTGLPPGTVIGHMHLRVSFLEDAERFYREVLGFDLTQRFGESAAFLSAGGYHHHIAVNVWAGLGAPQPPPGAIGLRHFEITLSTADAIADVARGIAAAGIDATATRPEPDAGGNDLFVRDPSGNGIRFSAPPA